MLRYVLKRIIWIIPVLLGVTIIVFSISYFTPGDVVMNILGSAGYSVERYAAKSAELGLDKPYIIQVLTYVKKVFLNFDFGISYATYLPITLEISNRLPITLRLNIMSLCVMVCLGLPLGMTSALKQYSVLDTTLTALALIIAAIPGFVLALLSALLFCVKLRWLPLSGLDTWKGWVLPVLCSSLGGIAVYTRYARTTMLEVIRQDYIRTARAKGLKESVVIRKHALINCMIPLVTIIGGFMTTLFGGSIIVETIFAIPGMGLYMMSGIQGRDYPITNGVVVMVSTLICTINLIVDLVYAFIDPRIRAHYESRQKKAKVVKQLLAEEA